MCEREADEWAIAYVTFPIAVLQGTACLRNIVAFSN
jgi:hypothetical protein